MTDSLCSRCGTPVAGSRCLKCGGTPTMTATHAAAAGTPAAVPAPAVGSTTDARIEQQHAQIATTEREIAAARTELAAQLGALEAGIVAHTTARRSALARDLRALEQQHTAAVTALDAREKERKAERERQTAMLRVRITNTIKQLGLALRDGASSLASVRPVIPSAATTESDLVPTTEVRELLAVGRLELPRAQKLDRDLPGVPALVPFVDSGHVIIESPSESADTALRGLLTSVVAQTYAAAPPGQMVVTVFNPKSSKALSGYLPTGATTAGILKILPPTRDALERSLEEHLDFMVRAEASIGNHTSMGSLVRATGQHEHQFHTLVILDAPIDWSDKAVALLEKLMSAGARAGLSIVLHRDPAAPAPDRVDISRVYDHASVLRRRGDSWTLSIPGISGTMPVTPADGVSDADQAHLMRLVVKGAEAGSLPNIPFADLIDDAPATSEHGLKISMGRKGTQATEFVLGDTVSNIQNVLVGGRAGSGKTNLLKVMIYSMAARYPRDELELFLLDFKEGGDFIPFAGDRDHAPLPNVSVVSRDCDAEFGIAALRHFTHEMDRRSTLTTDAGVSNIWDLRRKTSTVVPRWVLVVDEFQGMLAGPSNIEATELLENLVRKGRSFGLHVVLATQTLSGVRFSGSKDVAIFENTAGRIVLQLGPGEFSRFMQNDNDDGSQLRYRGQAIFNPAGGVKSENQLFVVARADEQHTLGLQQRLHTRAAQRGPVPPPFVYRGGEAVSLAELVAREGRPAPVDGDTAVWFGRQSTIDAAVAARGLGPVPGSHVALLGGDRRSTPSAIATLQAGVLSAVASASAPIDVLVLEALIPQFRGEARIDAWLDVVASLGARVVRYDADTAADFVDAITHAADARRRTLVVLLGAENTDFARIVDDGGQWRALIRDMPRRNVNIIGYWSDQRDLPRGDGSLHNDYKTILSFGKNGNAIVEATNQPRDSVPVLGDNRTIVFSADDSQQGLTAVASIRPLSHDDLEAFRPFAAAVPGSVEIGGAPAAPSVPPTAAPDLAQPSATTVPTQTSAPAVPQAPLPVTTLGDLLPQTRQSTVTAATALLGRGDQDIVALALGDTDRHVMILGRAAAGLPTVTVTLLLSLLARHDATELDVEIIDAMEGGELPPALATLPQVRRFTTTTDRDVLLQALRDQHAEIRRRVEVFAQHGAASFASYRAQTPTPLARRILVINEFAETLDDELANAIADVASGHTVGVHLVVTELMPMHDDARAELLARVLPDATRIAVWLPSSESHAAIGSAAATALARGTEALLARRPGDAASVFSLVETLDDDPAPLVDQFKERS